MARVPVLIYCRRILLG